MDSWQENIEFRHSSSQDIRSLPRSAMWTNILSWNSKPTRRVWTWESVMGWFWNQLGDTQASGRSVRASSPTPPKCSTRLKQENIKKSGTKQSCLCLRSLSSFWKVNLSCRGHLLLTWNPDPLASHFPVAFQDSSRPQCQTEDAEEPQPCALGSYWILSLLGVLTANQGTAQPLSW